jgi:hypothetical protein
LQPTSSKPLSFKVYASQGSCFFLYIVKNERKVESWKFKALKPHNVTCLLCSSFVISFYEFSL